MKPSMEFKIAGVVQSVEAVRTDGSSRHLAGPFPNLITNAGLDMLGTPRSGANYGYATAYVQVVRIGTGTTAPAPTDTELDSQIASVTSSSSSSGYISTEPYGVWLENEWLSSPLSESVVLGELGFAPTVDGELFSRTLIKDSDGEPTTVEVLEGERVRVRYRLNLYAPAEDLTGVTEFDFEGVPTEVTWVSRACRAGVPGTPSWNIPTSPNAISNGIGRVYEAGSILGSVTESPSGSYSSVNPQTSVTGSYVPGSHSLGLRISLGPTVGNVSGGIGAAAIEIIGMAYQMSFDPPFPKDANKTAIINFSISWGRAE